MKISEYPPPLGMSSVGKLAFNCSPLFICMSLMTFIRKKVTMFENNHLLLDFSLTVKAATLIFISWRGSAISSA